MMLNTLFLLNPLEQFSIFSVKSCLTSNFTSVIIMHSVIILCGFYFLGHSVLIRNAAGFFMLSLFNMLKLSYFKNTRLRTTVFLPALFFVFLIVLMSNLFGMIPHSYAITSSLIFNFYIIFIVFIAINIIGVVYHKWNFLGIFMPKGLPMTLAWFLIFFELISYLARIFSLTIRLFANMLSGHILQHILAYFTFQVLILPGYAAFLFFLPGLVVFLVTCLEVAICFLQAYVLITLLLIYFGNVINLH